MGGEQGRGERQGRQWRPPGREAAQEKATQEKATQEKATQEKATQEKATQEKATQEKAAREKETREKAHVRHEAAPCGLTVAACLQQAVRVGRARCGRS
ncbi:hypothetical protein ACDY99_00970 [Achromobacter dolens]|uniref:hypothetical protein n=1 Tax=Achromobacter dolens TaxID=1287738 RepID=UPI003558D3A5